MNHLKFIITLLCILNAAITLSQPKLDKTQWKLTFYEPFNETSINDFFNYNKNEQGNKKPWAFPSIFGPSDWASCGDAKDESVSASQLVFNEPDTFGYFYCAQYDNPPAGSDNSKVGIELFSTHDDFPMLGMHSGYVFGMFEIRCKLPRGRNTYPAFWLVGVNSVPPEIDVFEHDGDTSAFFSTIYVRHGKTQFDSSTFYNYDGEIADDFHTWTAVWTPTEIVWFFDGTEIKRHDALNYQPGYNEDGPAQTGKQFYTWNRMVIVIQAMVKCYTGEPKKFDPLTVDYVKVWHLKGYINFSNYIGTYNKNSSDNAYLKYQEFEKNLYGKTPYEY